MANKNTKLDIPKRIIYFSIGLIGASMLLVFSFQWDLLPFRFTFLTYDITAYMLASILVMTGVFASSLIKTGLTGKKQIDV